MILSGQLGEWSVADLIQILRITEKTASLTIEGTRRRGTLHFRGGKIVGAELVPGAHTKAPFELAVETVYVFRTMQSGSFSITHDAVPPSDHSFEVPDVLEAAAALFTDEDELVESGLLTARALRLTAEIDSAVTITPEDWPALVTGFGRFTFSEMEARVGRSPAVAVVALFRKLGVLEAAFAEPVPISEPAPEAERRREMRSMISPTDTTLVPGVLSDIRERFRMPEPRAGQAGAS